MEQMQYRRRFLDLVSLCIPLEERRRYPHLLTLVDAHVVQTNAPPSQHSTGVDAGAWKAQFIGVVWGVIESSVQGELKPVEIPSVQKHVPVVSTSLNLAIALHAEEIRNLDEQIFPGSTGVHLP